MGAGCNPVMPDLLNMNFRPWALSIILLPCATFSQQTEGEFPFDSMEFSRNRLFTMSTGRTMPAGKLSVADFEFFLVQLGYAPTEILQVNLSFLLPISKTINYWSVGTKVQVLPPSGFFRGLSIGADVGFFGEEDYFVPVHSNGSSSPPLVNVNVAASVGNDRATLHTSISQLQWSTDYGRVVVPSYAQLGADIVVSRPTETSGLKLMSELTWTQRLGSLNPAFMFVGLRTFSSTFTADFGWPFGFGDSGSFVPSQIPFFSFNFYL